MMIFLTINLLNVMQINDVYH